MQAPRYQVNYYLISEVIKKSSKTEDSIYFTKKMGKEKSQFAVKELTSFVSLFHSNKFVN
jgi:hypothetical protein